jgi:hypothetical protein
MSQKTDLTPITELCALISTGIYKLGFKGVPALRLERKVYGAMIDCMIEMEDPSLGPLLEVIQKFNARVCRQVDEVLHPRRQPDLLEQSSPAVKMASGPLDQFYTTDHASDCECKACEREAAAMTVSNSGVERAMHHGEEIKASDCDTCAVCDECRETHQNGFSPYPVLHIFADRQVG